MVLKYDKILGDIRENDSAIIDITYDELVAKIGASELNCGSFYRITDRGDNGIIVIACSNSKLQCEGIRFMLCPATYAIGEDAYANEWIGVWNAVIGATATEGQLTIWNGLVWVAGETLSGNAPDVEASGWTVIPKVSFTNHEYVEMVFGVEYDVPNDWINRQWDTKGNIIGIDKKTRDEIAQGGPFPEIPVDVTDWNIGTSGYNFYNNITRYCSNNSNLGDICDNIVTSIYSNSNNGAISNNFCLDIYSNLNNGSISGNTNSGAIYQNSNAGSIVSNSNAGSISENSNNGDITSNNCNCSIYQNSNHGAIGNNSNRTAISLNSNYGNIENNSCELINNNSNIGSIGYNMNNGSIENNSSGSTSCNITLNNNNGSISGIWSADVSDVVVDKVGV